MSEINKTGTASDEAVQDQAPAPDVAAQHSDQPNGEPAGASSSSSPEAPAAHDPAYPAYVAQLEGDLDAARRRVDELARGLQAVERDKEDFKKRISRERERMIDVEKGKVAVILLEAIDELDLSLRMADESPLAQGVRMIRENMLSRLAALGVERVPLENLPFDPNVAEAMDMEITPHEADDQKVLQEIRAAYRLGDRIIREGRVKVAKYIPPASA